MTCGFDWFCAASEFVAPLAGLLLAFSVSGLLIWLVWRFVCVCMIWLNLAVCVGLWCVLFCDSGLYGVCLA